MQAVPESMSRLHRNWMQKKVGRRLLATIWTGLFRITRSTNWNKRESISDTSLWSRFFSPWFSCCFSFGSCLPKKMRLPKSYLIRLTRDLYKKIAQPKKTLLHIPSQHLHHQKKTSLPHQVGPKTSYKWSYMGPLWMAENKWVSLGLKYHHTKKRDPTL